MGVFKDVMDTVKDINGITDLDALVKGSSARRYSSLSKRSLEGTLQFPTIVSRSLDIDTVQSMSKALERQFSTFVQISITMSPFMDIKTDKDVTEFLRKFHQNSGTKTDMNDVIHSARNILEHFNLIDDGDGNAYALSITCEGSTAFINSSNRSQMIDMLEHVRPEILNELFTPKKPHCMFPDKNLSAYHNGTVVTEAPTEDAIRRAGETLRKAGADDANAYRMAADDEARSDRLASDAEKNALQRQKNAQDARVKLKDVDITYVPQNILRDNDVRKANELIPTTMQLRLMLVDKENGGAMSPFDFIIGIKTTMHPVSSDEMVSNVVAACKNSSKIFNLIRWTTGEISFFKDFLFNVNEIKDDVFNRSSGASAWWITLKRRRALAKIKNLTFIPGQMLPNATLIMSQDEVEHIKSEHGYDLMNVSVVDKIMSKYFLLAFVVVDNAAQIAHFMFDGQSSYQSNTFSALEKENSNKADLKEVMKIINRSNMI